MTLFLLHVWIESWCCYHFNTYKNFQGSIRLHSSLETFGTIVLIRLKTQAVRLPWVLFEMYIHKC